MCRDTTHVPCEQTLMVLLPDLDDHIFRFKPQLIAELVENPSNIAVKLVKLRQLLPTADVAHIASKRSDLFQCCWVVLSAA